MKKARGLGTSLVPPKPTDKRKSIMELIPAITNMEIPSENHKGLESITEKLAKSIPVTPQDVQQFLADLRLPMMSTADVQRKFEAIGGSEESLNHLSEFFAFIANELHQHTEDEIFDAFDLFDFEEVRQFSFPLLILFIFE